jgi:hypothetical protein
MLADADRQTPTFSDMQENMQKRTTRSFCCVKVFFDRTGRNHWNLKELRLVVDDGVIDNPHHLIDTISAIQKERYFHLSTYPPLSTTVRTNKLQAGHQSRPS